MNRVKKDILVGAVELSKLAVGLGVYWFAVTNF